MAQLLVQCGVSFIAVLAFAILFHAPRREWAPCGLTGMVGWVVYWLAVQGGVSVVAASLYGTLALALLNTEDSLTNFGLVAAGGVISVIPITLFVIFAQNYLISGLSSGAVKE